MEKKNRHRKVILVGICMMIGVIAYFWIDDEYPFQSGEPWIDAVEKAKSMDKNQFIDYQVVEKKEESKELIAVVFNTDSECNVGFIDEYGNVVKEPFLKYDYDYEEKLRGDVGIRQYIGDYYEYYMNSKKTGYANTYYDRQFQEVTLSKKEIDQYNKEYRRKVDLVDKTEEDIAGIAAFLEGVIKSRYYINYSSVGYNGEIFEVGFVRPRPYDILVNKDLILETNLYFEDTTNLNLFAGPNRDSIVGNFFVKDFGLVYYNTHDEIIWITYCK